MRDSDILHLEYWLFLLTMLPIASGIDVPAARKTTPMIIGSIFSWQPMLVAHCTMKYFNLSITKSVSVMVGFHNS